MKLTTFLVLIVITFGLRAGAQIYDTNGEYVQTFAGYGEQGLYNGQGIYTKFNNPDQIVADTSGNLYVLDSGNYLIRKITQNATVTTYAGGGYDLEGYGTNVYFSEYDGLSALAIDHNNTLWLVAGSYPPSLFSIEPDGWVTLENSGSGLTNLSSSSSICFDSANNLYYSGGNIIWRYNPNTGIAQPFAGNGSAGYVNARGTIFPEFNSPGALACDQANNIYVWDAGNHLIRKIDQSQNVTTYAGNQTSPNYYNSTDSDGEGTNVYFSSINSMFIDHSGNLYLVGGNSYYYYNGYSSGIWVRKIDPQTNVVTMAGNFTTGGYTNGPGNLAAFNGAEGICLSDGVIYIADSGNQRIRDITFNPQPQVLSGASLQLNTYPGVTINGIIGHTYEIQSSPDLTNWTNQATVILNSSPYLWIDQNPVAGSKYYQAELLP